MNKYEFLEIELTLSPETQGMRLDAALSQLIPEHSRARIQSWIKEKAVVVNEEVCTKPRQKVEGNEAIHIKAKIVEQNDWRPQDLPLDIVFEDDDILVLNKAAGVVVHPAAGHRDTTLVNALLHHCPELDKVPRAGLIHRLDKETTGLLVVAKTLAAHTQLVEQLQAREFDRIYETVVSGVFTAGGTVDAPIGRHKLQRKKMAVTGNGKPSVTHYRIIKRYAAHTHVKIKLETGRTHQIRVHMAHINHPVVGDQAYGSRRLFPKGCSEALRECLSNFKRQALHAKELALVHPRLKEKLTWKSELPEDMKNLLRCLDDEENREK